MSLIPISRARGLLGQPVMEFNWEVVIPDPPPVISQYIESLSVKARGAMLPGVQQQGKDTHFGPFVFAHPGKKTYPKLLNMRFEESYTRPVLEALKIWADQSFDEEAGAGAPEDANKSNMWIRILGPNPEATVQGFTNAMHLYNVFPRNVTDASVNYQGESQLFINAVMAYNVWRWEPWPF